MNKNILLVRELDALATLLQWFDDEHMGLDEKVQESDEYRVLFKAAVAISSLREYTMLMDWGALEMSLSPENFKNLKEVLDYE